MQQAASAMSNKLLLLPPSGAGFQAYISGEWQEARRVLEQCKTHRRNRWEPAGFLSIGSQATTPLGQGWGS